MTPDTRAVDKGWLARSIERVKRDVAELPDWLRRDRPMTDAHAALIERLLEGTTDESRSRFCGRAFNYDDDESYAHDGTRWCKRCNLTYEQHLELEAAAALHADAEALEEVKSERIRLTNKIIAQAKRAEAAETALAEVQAAHDYCSCEMVAAVERVVAAEAKLAQMEQERDEAIKGEDAADEVAALVWKRKLEAAETALAKLQERFKRERAEDEALVIRAREQAEAAEARVEELEERIRCASIAANKRMP